MENKKNLTKEILIPEGITITIAERIVTVKGAAEISKKITTKRLSAEIKEGKVILKPNVKKPSKTEKKLINTLNSHIKNMIQGVNTPYVYKLKICSSHFPMGVALKGQEIEVTNFIGEKVPRILKIKDNTEIKIDGDIITISSPDKELAGQVAADIEKMVKRTKFDRRIFMDGIYIIEKAGVPVK